MVPVIDPEKTYYFLHIPKTAGTTFKNVLKQAFPPEQVCYAVNLGELSRMDHTNNKLFMGHYFYGIEKVIGRKPRYITFLRDPVKRFVSHYYQIKNQEWHPLHQYTESLEVFVETPVIQAVCSNVQTRMIAATIDRRIRNEWDKPALVLLREFEKLVRRSDRSRLDLAIKRLSEFEFCGNADFFEDSVQQLGLSWDGVKLNTGQEKVDLSEQLIASIVELNSLDIELIQRTRKTETG